MTEQLEKKMRNELYGWHIGEDNPAISGIEWYLNNLWHDASEKPADAEADIIIEGDVFTAKRFYACCTFNTPFLKWEIVKRWAYLEDILPSDLTGIKEGGKK